MRKPVLICAGNSTIDGLDRKWLWIACLFLTGTGLAENRDQFDARLWNQGRALYQYGVRIPSQADPNIVAFGDTFAPITLFTCAQCHGKRAEGQTESGIAAPPLIWQTLTKPYRVAGGQHRRRAPYDRESFHRALTHGIDPSQNALVSPMPRYRLDPAEIDALIQYLANIDRETPIGVDDRSIVLRVVFDARSTQKTTDGAGLNRLVQEFLDKINGRGGIYRRRLTLSKEASNGEANASFPFILLDLSGPDASDDSPTPRGFDETERSALTIRLFGPDTARANHLMLWPQSSFNRNALQNAALDHWAFDEPSLHRWQKLADIAASPNDRAPISNPPIAMILYPAEAGLLNYLSHIKPPDAPALLIENWFANPQLTRFTEAYSGTAYALVPEIPEPSLRSLVQDYPDLISLPAFSDRDRIRRLWTLYALDRINQVLRQCGRVLTIEDFVENWRNLQNQDRDRVRLIPVTHRPNPHEN